MEQKQLHQIGDKVWFLKNNKPVQEEITGVQSRSKKGEPIIEVVDKVTTTTYKSVRTFEYCTTSIFAHHKEVDVAKTIGELIHQIFFTEDLVVS